MSLPKQIPLQTVPLAEKAPDGNFYIDFNWYLFLFNLTQQIFPPSGEGGGGVPPLPIDLIDMTDLDAATTDIYQAYRRLSNLQALSSVDADVSSADGAGLRQRDVNVQMLLPEQDVYPSLRDLKNAFALALDSLLPDPVPAAQPAITVSPSASPFTYTALFNGVLSVTGGTVSAISIIRQGTTVATGITAGLVHVRRSDQVRVTYTSAPTVVFLSD